VSCPPTWIVRRLPFGERLRLARIDLELGRLATADLLELVEESYRECRSVDSLEAELAAMRERIKSLEEDVADAETDRDDTRRELRQLREAGREKSP